MTTSFSYRAITREGLQRLEEDLERLRREERPELAVRLQAARETPGDPSDNLEFLELQQELAMLEGRIAELELAIANAWTPETPEEGTVGLGSTVKVRDDEGETDTYRLVGSAEAHPREGLISIESPVGRALVSARKGDVVEVETPAGPRQFKILEVQ